MAKYNLSISLSPQAELLMASMPEVKQDELIDWFINVRQISIGGGDIVNYLQYLESKNKIVEKK